MKIRCVLKAVRLDYEVSAFSVGKRAISMVRHMFSADHYQLHRSNLGSYHFGKHEDMEILTATTGSRNILTKVHTISQSLDLCWAPHLRN